MDSILAPSSPGEGFSLSNSKAWVPGKNKLCSTVVWGLLLGYFYGMQNTNKGGNVGKATNPTEPQTYICARCNKTLPTLLEGQCTSNYGRNGELHYCLPCIGIMDEEEFINAPVGAKKTLYLTIKEGEWSVTNWPGTFKRPCTAHSEGNHNIVGKRFDSWFWVDGWKWHGVTFGTGTQIHHCTKLKPGRNGRYVKAVKQMEPVKTFKVIRVYKSGGWNKTLRTGLTLEQARMVVCGHATSKTSMVCFAAEN